MANREFFVPYKGGKVDREEFRTKLFDDLERCEDFFNKLADLMKDEYVLLDYRDTSESAYLIPIGTEDQMSWYGKPEWSFRISGHWSWYANTKKCADKDIVQCESVDLPVPRDRRAETGASMPIYAAQVCVYYNGKYHCIYGNCYSRKRIHGKHWTFREADPKAIAESYLEEKGVA